jgi:hypothetical protein
MVQSRNMPAESPDQPKQLPAIIPPGTLATATDPIAVVPALIADAGDAAGWRYVEFFTANISNPHTRRAYARACGRFFGWCDESGTIIARLSRRHVFQASPPCSSRLMHSSSATAAPTLSDCHRASEGVTPQSQSHRLIARSKPHKPHYVKSRLAPEHYDGCLKSVLHRDVPAGRAGSSPSSANTAASIAASSVVTVLCPEGRSRK